MNIKKILVTGANGFVGKALCKTLLEKNFQVCALLRSAEKIAELKKELPSDRLDCKLVGDLDKITNWSVFLHDIDAVIHLAARVHIMQDNTTDPLAEYRRINVQVTEKLADAAAKAGVKRFIYLSSIKVNGENNSSDSLGNMIPFTEQDIFKPVDPYGLSKWEAEQHLRKISQNSSLQTIIIRPPLVYGKGVKANFQSLLRLVQKGFPLPLAKVNNQRSLIYVGNLVDAIVTCLTHDKASNQTYVISDNEAVSTAELIRAMAAALGKKAYLWPVPFKMMLWLAKLTGKTKAVDRLFGSLIVDGSKIKNDLNWNPPYSLTDALRRDFGCHS